MLARIAVLCATLFGASWCAEEAVEPAERTEAADEAEVFTGPDGLIIRTAPVEDVVVEEIPLDGSAPAPAAPAPPAETPEGE